MIISNIIGGLGNQMFQFACGRALALDLNQPLRFSTDLFANYALHQGLMLESVFGLKLPVTSSSELRLMLGLASAHPLARRLLARWPLPRGSRFVAEPPDGSYIDLRQVATNGAYLHGYWQSERHFKAQANAVRTDFMWGRALEGRNEFLSQAIQSAPLSVSLHVRRGDYVSSAKNQSIYATCTAEYYFAALDRLRRLGPLKVFAFSDDPAWVARVLAPKCPDLVIVDHNRGKDSAFDMQLMSMCRHHIIANSSFSWWGAWLDARPNKVVIAPAKWYVDWRDDKHLVPTGWHRL